MQPRTRCVCVWCAQVLESVTAGNLASEGGNYAVMPELLLQDKIMSGLLGQVGRFAWFCVLPEGWSGGSE